MRGYKLKTLQKMPTLCVGQTDDLKVEIETRNKKTNTLVKKRIWLSRLTVEDGAEYDNQVTVEQFFPGGHKPTWRTINTYQAK